MVSFLDDIEGYSLNNYVVTDYCLLAKSHLGQLLNDLNIVDDNYSNNNILKNKIYLRSMFFILMV